MNEPYKPKWFGEDKATSDNINTNNPNCIIKLVDFVRLDVFKVPKKLSLFVKKNSGKYVILLNR